MGLTVSAGAAIVAGGAGAANASTIKPLAPRAELGVTSLDAGLQGADTALGAGTEGALMALTPMKLNPLAGTGSDPFDNSVATQVGQLEPVSTAPVTQPLSSGASLGNLGLLDQVNGLLPASLVPSVPQL
ncbi:hypothetical protein CTZ27_20640 [Streptomyces griseocarneus]|nr:hypothetical protein CTZ27_20640 [Streptomyces griseocarneus]